MKRFLNHLKSFLLLALISLAVISQAKGFQNKIVVAADGSGNFRTVTAAVKAIVNKTVDTQRPLLVYIKNGVYKEKVVIPVQVHDVYFQGEDASKTIITWDDYSGKGDINTFTSYTIKILGHDLSFKNLTFRNSEGLNGQAVALDIEGNHCVFRDCRIVGNQDALYAAGNNSQQYFKDCHIEGTTDFIFGSSTAVFQNCDILCKKNSFITAARTPKGRKFGYVFLNCSFKANPGVTKVYLGRPWRAYANVVYKNCKLGSFIRPAGWSNWHQTDRYKTAYYAEYHNTGPGANTSHRVPWSHQLTRKQAREYTVENILGLSKWKVK